MGKRAYQCIKCLVALFSSCPAAHQILLSNAEFKHKWTAAVDWLHEELDRPYPAGNNQYNQWSPPAQSNETSNGYFLERSHSAKLTLEKSIELCPDEEAEAEEAATSSTSSSTTTTTTTTTSSLLDDPSSTTGEVAPPPPTLSSNEDFP